MLGLTMAVTAAEASVLTLRTSVGARWGRTARSTLRLRALVLGIRATGRARDMVGNFVAALRIHVLTYDGDCFSCLLPLLFSCLSIVDAGMLSFAKGACENPKLENPYGLLVDSVRSACILLKAGTLQHVLDSYMLLPRDIIRALVVCVALLDRDLRRVLLELHLVSAQIP